MNYKTYDPDQLFLLPPSLKEWLPESHLAYFAKEVVDDWISATLTRPTAQNTASKMVKRHEAFSIAHKPSQASIGRDP